MKNIFLNKTIFNIFFIIIIILLPLQTRYFLITEKINNNFFEYGSISLYAIDILILFFVIYGIIFSIKNKINLEIKSKLFLIFLFLFNASIFSSIFFSLDKGIAFYNFGKIFLLSCFSFLIFINKINIKTFTNAFIFSSSIQAFVSIYQFITQSIISNKFLGVSEQLPYNLGTYVIEGFFGRILKSYGTFSHPNMLAIFLLIGLIFILLKISNHKKNIEIIDNKKIDFEGLFLIYLFGLNLIGLIFTFSRLGLILFFVSFSFLLIREIKKYFDNRLFEEKINYNLKIFGILVSIILITTLNASELLISRVDAKNRLVEKSTNERLIQLRDFKNYIKDNYLQGIGIGNFTIKKHLENKNLNIWDIQPIHNIYLTILLELGIFGFLSFLAISIFKIIIDRKNIEIIFPLIVILSFGLLDHFMITLSFGLILLFIFLGIQKENDKYDVV